MDIYKKIKQTLYLEKLKYQKKGLKNIIIGSLLLFAIIYGLGQLGRIYWPQHIEDKITFVIIISFIIHFGCELLYLLIFLPGYLNLSSYYQKHRISPQLPKQWQRKGWSQLRNKTLKYLFINQLLVYPFLFVFGMKNNGLQFRFDNFPSTWQIIGQTALLFYLQDFFNYSMHRICHQVPFLYKFHKVHHQYQNNFTIVAEYTHIFDYIISIIGPSLIAFSILGSFCHCYMFFFWQVYKLFSSRQAHSGYEFHWSPVRLLPFVASPSYHNFHHSKNVGNFAGSVYIYDTFLSKQPTNKLYFEQFFLKDSK